ncbi:MAG: RNA-binding S4 domain-containing protein [Pseudomonadota bacterium]
MTTGQETEQIRLDKWLWRARFFKSRSLAATVCSSGRVRIDGTPVAKAHATVRPGQVLTFVKERHVRVIKVLAIPTRRGPAPEAQACYEDLAPPETALAMPGGPPRRVGRRPTKKDRRQMDQFAGAESSLTNTE